MTAPNRSPHGVVFSGGGAYAAYEVGVVQALVRGLSPATGLERVTPRVYSGTSAGALNAAVMASTIHAGARRSAEYLETVWLDGVASRRDGCDNGIYRFLADPVRLLAPQCADERRRHLLQEMADDATALTAEALVRTGAFLTATTPLQLRALASLDLSALISVEPLDRLIRANVPFRRLARHDAELRVTATNWTTGVLKVFGNSELAGGDGADAILASAAIPGVFPPVRIGPHLYVDGGVLMNTPLKPAIGAGAQTLHLIYLDPDVDKIPLARLRNTIDAIERVRSIQNASVLNLDIETAAQVNRGLAATRGDVDVSLSGSRAASSLVRFIGQVGRRPGAALKYKPLTIHRYRPTDDLGEAVGVLDVRRQVIRRLIERGFRDAIAHDCAACGCISPDGVGIAPRELQQTASTPSDRIIDRGIT